MLSSAVQADSGQETLLTPHPDPSLAHANGPVPWPRACRAASPLPDSQPHRQGEAERASLSERNQKFSISLSNLIIPPHPA